MSWGIIAVFVAIGVVIGNWMWLAPTPRQRNQIKMRNQAFSSGLKVQRAVEQYIPSKDIPDDWVSYYLPSNLQGEQHQFTESDWPEGLKNAIDLSLLPDQYVVIWIDSGAGICWKESDKLSDVENIKKLLEQLLEHYAKS